MDHYMPPLELITKRNWMAPDLWDWNVSLTNNENTVTTNLVVTMSPDADAALFCANEHLKTKPGWKISGMTRLQATAADE